MNWLKKPVWHQATGTAAYWQVVLLPRPRRLLLEEKGMPSFTGRFPRVLAAVLAGLILTGTGEAARADTSAPAGTPAMRFSTASLGFDPRYLTLGWVFTTNADIDVDALGYYDYKGTGLRVSHKVGIFDSEGTLLASTTVAAGTTDPLIGTFRYALIPPITLSAGETYTIAGTADTYLNPIGYDLWGRDVVGLTSDPSVIIPVDAGRFNTQKNNSLVDPTKVGRTDLYAGPNFLIAGAPSPAPGPGSSSTAAVPQQGAPYTGRRPPGTAIAGPPSCGSPGRPTR